MQVGILLKRSSLNHFIRIPILLFGIGLSLVCACRDTVEPTRDGGIIDGFDSHTFSGYTSIEVLRDSTLKTDKQVGLSKFIVTGIEQSNATLSYYDLDFYTYHDEWYWYHLLNGEQLPGANEATFDGMFSTIQSVYSWAEDNRLSLPLDLRFTRDGRLYSERFYAHGMRRVGDPLEKRQAPRMWVPGSLVVPTSLNRPVGFTLEYADMPQHIELIRLFEVIAETLPAELRSTLVWYTRSSEQADIATAFVEEYPAFSERIRGYDSLSTPGDFEIYSTGTAAGRIRFVESEEGLSDIDEDDIVIFTFIPDELPICAAVVTTSPQTGLAHINLLAQNRGIPNIYWADAKTDPQLDQIERGFGYGLFEVTRDEFHIRPLSRSQYLAYRSARTLTEIEVPNGELDSDPRFVTNDISDLESLFSYTPYIGGKAGGFYYLTNAAGVRTPPGLLFLTKEFERTHRHQLTSELSWVLNEAGVDRDRDYRKALLEGEGSGTWSSDARAIIDAGGLQGIYKSREIDEYDLAEINGKLREHFVETIGLSTMQGLRFRSSSTVEDLEGFNGAGLYRSKTGFFSEAGGRSFADALRRVWASYWGIEAYDERSLFKIDHRSGSMAVVVHPRFDDDKELANGVAVIHINRDGGLRGVLNTQIGALSVANPEPGILPEVLNIVGDIDQPRIELQRYSSEHTERILPESEEESLLQQLISASDFWLTSNNELLAEHVERSLVTLDFEYKWMDAGWPTYTDGHIEPASVILKQLRTLEPSTRFHNQAMRDLDAPQDRKSRAEQYETIHCEADASILDLDILYMSDRGVEDFSSPIYLHRLRWQTDADAINIYGHQWQDDMAVLSATQELALFSAAYDAQVTVDLEASRMRFSDGDDWIDLGACRVDILYQDPSRTLSAST